MEYDECLKCIGRRFTYRGVEYLITKVDAERVKEMRFFDLSYENDRKIGSVSADVFEHYIRVGEFVLLPDKPITITVTRKQL